MFKLSAHIYDLFSLARTYCTANAVMPSIVLNVAPDACSGTPVQYKEYYGTIQSPGYDMSTYPDNSHCQWFITAYTGYVSIFRQCNIVMLAYSRIAAHCARLFESGGREDW